MTCPLGSDFTFDLTGREGIADDGDLSAGAFGNLPCGEGFISPLAGGHARGRSLASLGLPAEPVALAVRGRPAGGRRRLGRALRRR